MRFDRYRRVDRSARFGNAPRSWPDRTLDRAPLWSSVDLRDGNQALPNPMSPARKSAMFDLLVRLGFKDIEVGYPSASEADFTFVRDLVEGDRIPDDVTISVFTPARPELIDRTFEAVRGVRRAVIHLCNATACLWRETVFGLTPDEVRRMATDSAERLLRLTDTTPGSDLRFEYSPETFNVTEPEYVLDVCDAVASTVDASPDRPLILNLPSTVETDSPNVFADQVEWMHRNLARRDGIILSVHPHNDRGTAVASAELALMAGADRVEGTLFGNGERTGNVCLATLALNLFSHGIDPQLDFTSIDEVRRTVEHCNELSVHPRHPYVGDLVYTAFSGTHQDAIAKGFVAMERWAASSGTPVRDHPWQVPYLPIDPQDVGRSYESVVRVNSQSGKGGMGHVLRNVYGLDLPREMRVEFARHVQQVADREGTELSSARLWQCFRDRYLPPRPRLVLHECHEQTEDDGVVLTLVVDTSDGFRRRVRGFGGDTAAACCQALSALGHLVRVQQAGRPSLTRLDGCPLVVFTEVQAGDLRLWGVGLAATSSEALVQSLVNAVNRVPGVPRPADPADPSKEKAYAPHR
ncbi:2-isopropylmalate synthase [Geodermatophilus sp. URMC 62]|uniref:2-isopropylmalate synthase n=1 Tax=Geodermatophilus sp. URMC 62 TaxID=3423414 RepID=UPI00406D146F